MDEIGFIISFSLDDGSIDEVNTPSYMVFCI